MESIPAAGLGWPIKASFARYVGGLVDGRIDLIGPVSASRDCGLIFRLEDSSAFDISTESGVIKFGGAVQFQGHFGMLRVVIADPWLSVDGSLGTLSIATGPDKRVKLAACRVSWDETGYVARGTELMLNAGGVALFGDGYEEGSYLDPFLLRLESGAEAS